MRGLVLMEKPWLSPGGQGLSPDPGVGADWLWGLAESLSLAVSQFPLLRSERVGLSAAQPLGRWWKGWWARPGLKLPAPMWLSGQCGLLLATFLHAVHCQVWENRFHQRPWQESLQFSALPSEPSPVKGAHSGFALGCRARWDSAQGGLVASTSVRAHGGSQSPPGSGEPRGRSDGNHLGARSLPPSRAAAVGGGLTPHPRLLAMESAGGMELLQPRGPDSLSGPGPWGTLVFNF